MENIQRQLLPLERNSHLVVDSFAIVRIRSSVLLELGRQRFQRLELESTNASRVQMHCHCTTSQAESNQNEHECFLEFGVCVQQSDSFDQRHRADSGTKSRHSIRNLNESSRQIDCQMFRNAIRLLH